MEMEYANTGEVNTVISIVTADARQPHSAAFKVLLSMPQFRGEKQQNVVVVEQLPNSNIRCFQIV